MNGTYVVVLERDFESTEELLDLAGYLSSLSVRGFEVAIIDTLPSEQRIRVLRWVGRYLATDACNDRVRTAMDVASCEKVLVADSHVRYDEGALDHLCALLDLHEVVEPQEYFDPMPWWGGLEAGRVLLRRGIGPRNENAVTFGFRKRAIRGLHNMDSAFVAEPPVRRLESSGAEVFPATDVFVRRLPGALDRWLRDRPRQFDQPAIFFGVLPLALILSLLSGPSIAAAYLVGLAIGAVAFAIRGRFGAGAFFPFRACFYAPLWMLERSVSVYWALLVELTGTTESDRVAIPPNRERVTSRPSSTANTL